MRVRHLAAALAAGFAAAFAAVGLSAALAQILPEQVPAKRPDGTIVYPAPESRDGAPATLSPASATRAEERERLRKEAQQSAEDRLEQSRREREGASTSPARQIPPTVYPR